MQNKKNRKLKKAAALLLSLAMILTTVSVPAFAAEEIPDEEAIMLAETADEEIAAEVDSAEEQDASETVADAEEASEVIEETADADTKEAVEEAAEETEAEDFAAEDAAEEGLQAASTTAREAEEASYTVTIDNRVGGDPEIYIGDAQAVNGDTVSSGTFTVYVYPDYITDELSEGYVTVKVGGKVVNEPVQIGYGNCEIADVKVDGDVKIVINADDTAEEDEKPTHKITVTNDAAEANNDSAVNGLHVYPQKWHIDESTGRKKYDLVGDDIEGTAEVEEGCEIAIDISAQATDVHVLAEHNGEVFIDKLYEQRIGGVYEEVLPSLDGDLVVTTTAYYKVNIDDQAKDEDVIFNVATVDFSGDAPKQVPLASGDTLRSGEMVASNVVNDGTSMLKLQAQDGDGALIEEQFIMPGGANGIYVMGINKHVNFVLTKEAVDLSKVAKLTLAKDSYSFTGKAVKADLKVDAEIGLDTAELKEGTDYTVSYQNNTKAGTATVTVTGKDNYSGTLSATFKITAAAVTPAVTIKTTSYTYDGKVKTPEVTVSVNGKALAASDYTLSYTGNRKSVGTHTVTVTLKGNYSGKASTGFDIVPKGVSLKKAAGGKKKFTAKWKKTAGVTGYQIQYSSKKSFAAGKKTKTVTVKGAKKKSKVVKKLKKGKYFVRIRTYKTVNGKKYYSAWSKAKKATVKK